MHNHKKEQSVFVCLSSDDAVVFACMKMVVGGFVRFGNDNGTRPVFGDGLIMRSIR